MRERKFDIRKYYDSADDFFNLEGSVCMKLTREAAIQVCLEAIKHNQLVMRIEGGIRHFPNLFEARLDCIWDGKDPPIDKDSARGNNLRAADFIREEDAIHDAFIITSSSIFYPVGFGGVILSEVAPSEYPDDVE